MKLKLEKFIEPQKFFEPPPKGSQKYANPIGWWKVFSDGDEEGRSARELGEYYGHVAEIAFSIEQDALYDYRFIPSEKTLEPENYPTYIPKRKFAHISLGVDSNTWGLDRGQKRIEWWKNWLDSEDIVVKQSCFYTGILIELAPHLIS